MNKFIASSNAIVEFAEGLQKAETIADFLNLWFTYDLLSESSHRIFCDYYANWRRSFNPYIRYHYSDQIRELAQCLGRFPQPEVLEVGCGCGTETLYMSYALAANVTAIDLRSERLAVAIERKTVMENCLGKPLACIFQNCSLFELARGTIFDVIWLEQAFHHLEPRREVALTLSKHLKPGGYLVISESNYWNPYIQLDLFMKRGTNTLVDYTDISGKQHQYGNERIISASGICEIMAAAGVEHVQTRYYRLFPNFACFERLRPFEQVVPQWFRPFFVNYNWVGRKSA